MPHRGTRNASLARATGGANRSLHLLPASSNLRIAENGVQAMKSGNAWLVIVLALTACADLSITDSWKGHNVSELKAHWGEPTQVYDLAGGGKHLVYRMAEDSGQVMMGDTKRYILVRRCYATFTTDSHGVIISAEQEGTPGGCSILLKGVKPGAPAR